MGIRHELLALKKQIKIGVVGVGAMGKGLAHQCSVTPNMDCVALADIDLDKAIDVANNFNFPYRVCSTPTEVDLAVGEGLLAICEDGNSIAESNEIDVLIEASSSILAGAQFVVTALEHGTPVALMNAEIDLTYGPYFHELARQNNIVCTSIDGDQYGVIKHLVDDLLMWGFELVMVGNIKGFLNLYANPTNIIPEADKRNLDYKMCTAMTDGTKISIEMALLANAFGLHTDVPGMHGPKAEHIGEALTLFDFEKMWKRYITDGILESEGFVDYILGAEPGGGVFAVGWCKHPYQKAMLKYYKMGGGPYYLFYRPYHLCHIEALESVARAYLYGECLLYPKYGFRTEVYAYAKEDSHPGQELDGLGGYICYGMIDNSTKDWRDEGLPICLSENLHLRCSVEKDEPILLQDTTWDPKDPKFELYTRAREARLG